MSDYLLIECFTIMASLFSHDRINVCCTAIAKIHEIRNVISLKKRSKYCEKEQYPIFVTVLPKHLWHCKNTKTFLVQIFLRLYSPFVENTCFMPNSIPICCSI